MHYKCTLDNFAKKLHEADGHSHYISFKKDKKSLIDEIMGGEKATKMGVTRPTTVPTLLANPNTYRTHTEVILKYYRFWTGLYKVLFFTTCMQHTYHENGGKIFPIGTFGIYQVQ